MVNAVSDIGGQQADASVKKSLGKDEFLRLLIAQLKNQDPLSPMENTEFTAQMAQFSSLEQLFNVNDNLESLQTLNAAVANTQALALIGKQIQAEGDIVYVLGGKASGLVFNLDEQAVRVTVHITDASGNIVRTVFRGAMSGGMQEVAWDGKSDVGGSLPDGLYGYVVDAVNAAGEPVDSDSFMSGVVEAVSMDNGITYVHIGDAKVMITEIIEVRQQAQN